MDKYRVIYIDPPWRYDNKKTGGSNISGASQKYDTMTLGELKSFDIMAADDSILFMWCTVPLLPEALELLNHWGYKYKTSIIWEKMGMLGMGYWMRINTELILVGIRGNVKPFRSNKKNIIKAPIQAHSKKPDIFRKLIEQLTDNVTPRIEYFARTKIHGWETFGNDEKLYLEPLEKYSR